MLLLFRLGFLPSRLPLAFSFARAWRATLIEKRTPLRRLIRLTERIGILRQLFLLNISGGFSNH